MESIEVKISSQDRNRVSGSLFIAMIGIPILVGYAVHVGTTDVGMVTSADMYTAFVYMGVAVFVPYLLVVGVTSAARLMHRGPVLIFNECALVVRRPFHTRIVRFDEMLAIDFPVRRRLPRVDPLSSRSKVVIYTRTHGAISVGVETESCDIASLSVAIRRRMGAS